MINTLDFFTKINQRNFGYNLRNYSSNFYLSDSKSLSLLKFMCEIQFILDFSQFKASFKINPSSLTYILLLRIKYLSLFLTDLITKLY